MKFKGGDIYAMGIFGICSDIRCAMRNRFYISTLLERGGFL